MLSVCRRWSLRFSGGVHLKSTLLPPFQKTCHSFALIRMYLHIKMRQIHLYLDKAVTSYSYCDVCGWAMKEVLLLPSVMLILGCALFICFVVKRLCFHVLTRNGTLATKIALFSIWNRDLRWLFLFSYWAFWFWNQWIPAMLYASRCILKHSLFVLGARSMSCTNCTFVVPIR